ncbi:hypothetical protein IKQ26_07635 [bacterium]|nr:hypothetical protein [bacterium]
MRNSVLFAVLFLSVSVLTLTLGLYFNFSSALNGNKIAQFAFFNSAVLVFIGIFFLIFNDKINVYLQNYRREKKI